MYLTVDHNVTVGEASIGRPEHNLRSVLPQLGEALQVLPAVELAETHQQDPSVGLCLQPAQHVLPTSA